MNMSYCVWTVLVYLIYRASSQCTFPSSLQGQWLRSRDTKTLSFTSPSTVTGFNLESKKQTVDEFTCYITEGSKYVLRSERYNNILPDTYIYIYICYDMVAVGSKAFYIYELTERTSEINNNERGAVFSDNIPVTLSDICTLTRNDVQYTTLVSIVGLASNSITYCPDILLGAFNYTQEALVSKCTGTSTLTACNNRVSISADQTSCSGDYFGYSVGGYFLCTATLQFSTVTYVTLYNKDSTVDGSTAYRFSCLAIERSGDELLMTQYPTDCELGQSGTSVSSPGFKFTLQPKVLCPIPIPTTTSGPSTGATVDDNNIPLIVGVLVGVIFLLALILIIILCVRAKKRKKAKVADSTESPFGKEKQQNGLHPQDRNKANSPTSTNGVFILPNNNKGESNLHFMDENENNRRSSGEVIGTKHTEKPPEVLLGLSSVDDKPRTNITKSMSPQVTASRKNLQQIPTNGEVKNATSSQLNHTSSSPDYKNHTDSNSTPYNTTNDTGKTAVSSNSDIQTGQTNGSSKKSMGVNNDDVHDSEETHLANSVTTLQNTKHVSAKNTKGILKNEDNSPNKGPSASNVPENAPMISGQGAGVKSHHAQDDETTILATNVKALHNREQASAKNAQGRQNNLDNSINKGPNGSDFSKNTPMTSNEKIKGDRGGNDAIQEHASTDGGAILASNSAFLQNTTQSPTKNNKLSSLNDTSSNGHNRSGLHRNISDDKTKGGDLKNGTNNDHTRINDETISAASVATVSKNNVQTSVTKNKGKDSPKNGSNESNFHQNISGISVDKSTGDAVNNNSAKYQACVNSGVSSASGIPQQTENNSAKNSQSKQNDSQDSSYMKHDRTSLSSDISENDNGEPVGKQQLENQMRRNKNGVLSNSDGIADHTSENVNPAKTSPPISQSINPPNMKFSAHVSEAVIPEASMRKSCTSDTSTTKNASGSEVTKSQDSLNTFHESGFNTPISYDTEGASLIDEEQTRTGLSKRGASKKRRIKNKTDPINHSSVYQVGASNIIEGLSGKFQMDRIKAAKKKKRRRHGVASKSKSRNKSQLTSDSEEMYSDTSSDFDARETDLFDPGSFQADGQEIIARKESVISSVGPASCALISPKDNPTKKTSVISQIADGDTDTIKSKKKDQKDKSKSKKKKRK